MGCDEEKISHSPDAKVFAEAGEMRIRFVQPLGAADQQVKLTIEDQITRDSKTREGGPVLVSDVEARQFDDTIQHYLARRTRRPIPSTAHP
ncbi:MAG TPA: hypothetical protein VH682_18695 [Gemmataceae bacterium]